MSALWGTIGKVALAIASKVEGNRAIGSMQNGPMQPRTNSIGDLINTTINAYKGMNSAKNMNQRTM